MASGCCGGTNKKQKLNNSQESTMNGHGHHNGHNGHIPNGYGGGSSSSSSSSRSSGSNHDGAYAERTTNGLVPLTNGHAMNGSIPYPLRNGLSPYGDRIAR